MISNNRKRELITARDRILEDEEFNQWINLRIKELELDSVDLPPSQRGMLESQKGRLTTELRRIQKARTSLQVILGGVPQDAPQEPPPIAPVPR